MPRVSVIIPVLDAERFIIPALKSVVAQTFRDFELVVVDDASTDSSRAIALTYLSKEKCGRLISIPKRVGVARAINVGLTESDSEFVARLDSDDFMAPNRLAQQVAVMSSFSRLGVLGSWVKTFGSREMRLRFPKSHDEIMLEMGFRNAIAFPSYALSRFFRLSPNHALRVYQ